jgi:predicted aldo/keto reductase-like oxidoreductase
MEYRALGRTGLQISPMGLGGIPVQRIDAEGTKQLLQKLVAAGVNYIDTARGYTVSEEYIGYGLEGIRDKFVLATKSMARTREAMAADIDISLKNLRTNYIDLYQVHNPGPKDLETVIAPGGALEALLEARQAGKIGHIGITLHSADMFQKALELSWVETIMFPYNLVETQGEDLIRICGQKGIGFIAMKPLAGGAIEDATLALRFIGQNSNVSVVIPGMAEEKELQQNLAAVADTTPLSLEEKQKINRIRSTLGTQFCRRCNYCSPCPMGIGIPGIFVLEGYFSRYNLQDWAMTRYNGTPVKASACIGCGACEARCPYQLPIRKMLKNVVNLMEK